MKILLYLILLSICGCSARNHPLQKHYNTREAQEIIDSNIYNWSFAPASKVVIDDISSRDASVENIIKTLEISYRLIMYTHARWTPNATITPEDHRLICFYRASKPLGGSDENALRAYNVLNSRGISNQDALTPPHYFELLREAAKTNAMEQSEKNALKFECLAVFWMVAAEPEKAAVHLVTAKNEYLKASKLYSKTNLTRSQIYKNKAQYCSELTIGLYQASNLVKSNSRVTVNE